MSGILKVSAFVDRLNRTVGLAVCWLILVVVVISAGNAMIRRFFDQSSNAWLEAQWYLFSAIFLLCAAYTLLRNEHIRIDIVSNGLSRTSRSWIDVTGHLLFLMPLCVIMLVEAWPYFMQSFQLSSEGVFNDIVRLFRIAIGASQERYSIELSSNAGGLPRWPVKLLIVVGFSLLLLQGISELIKRVAIMTGHLPEPQHPTSGPH